MYCTECGLRAARIIHLENGGRLCAKCYADNDETYQPLEEEGEGYPEDVYEYIQKISSTSG